MASRVLLLARSDASAWRAEEQAQKLAAKVDGADGGRIKVTTDPADLADCDLVVEAIVEELGPKVDLLSAVGEAAGDADLATTTSSLSLDELGSQSGHAERVFGLHPFNPVARMELIELCLPDRGPRGDPPPSPGLVRGDRQDRRRGAERARLRRQPAALPLPLRRRPPDGADRHGGRGGRPLHDPRGELSDGAARPARPDRGRRRRRDRRGAPRRQRRGPPPPARTADRPGRTRASSGASPAPASTSTTSRRR